MLAATPTALHEKATLLCDKLLRRGITAEVVPTEDQVGGGSVPTQLLPTFAVSIHPGALSLEQLEERLRRRERPIIGRISHDRYLLDARTLMERDFDFITDTVAEVLL